MAQTTSGAKGRQGRQAESARAERARQPAPAVQEARPREEPARPAAPEPPAPGHSAPGRSEAERASLDRLHRLAGSRVAIEGVSPEIDGGRFPPSGGRRPLRRRGRHLLRRARQDRRGAPHPPRRRATAGARRRWPSSTTTAGAASPLVEENARYLYTIIAWRDLFASWRDEVVKKHAAGMPIALELIEGRHLIEADACRERAARRGRPGGAGAARSPRLDEERPEAEAARTPHVAGDARR